jgi:hypothetical protein
VERRKGLGKNRSAVGDGRIDFKRRSVIKVGQHRGAVLHRVRQKGRPPFLEERAQLTGPLYVRLGTA